MKRSSARLRPLLDLAGLNGQEAALRLARSFSELARAERELAQVRDYMHDYRPGAATTAPVSPGKLENDRVFIARLTEVIALQTTKLEATRSRHEVAVSEWQRAHRHNKAMQTLFETYCRRELAELERREGEEVDELMHRWLDSAGWR
jgi:flagellar export protein FliJ